ncbi:MAG: bifunctional folylpolyglutamate synthase/dihydrofolate synthase [Ignavibacteriales bacterium]|nr:MAG: bifunctional folylpolyglutamate synthase/dihydrofolate synthase [Ignavibacteriales bacterium]
MDIKSSLEKLFSLHQFGIKLGLDSTLQLLERIGNPHEKFKTFHIAGSNGKGSTASFMSSLLMESGYRVGLYTSPHFVKFNERIRINGVMIDDEYVAKFVTELEDYIKKYEPTFFEITTVLAFKYFYEQKVDYAVIETGLGGRLDSTNVINPIASVITSISLEHTQHLGDTLEKIAFEKAGIIKQNSRVFVGRIAVEPEKIIRNRAKELNCDYNLINDFTTIEGDRLIVGMQKKSFSIYSTPLRGAHQLYNAALAVKTISQCLNQEDGIIISRGIKNVIVNSGIQGRYEIICNKPKIIFDSAHNPEGVKSFIEEFSKEYNSYKERILLFGVMKDKSIREMLELLKPYFNRIVVTKIDIDRSATPGEIEVIAHSVGMQINIVQNGSKFVQDFFNERTDKCLVVLGSMYLLGEIKSKMLEKSA